MSSDDFKIPQEIQDLVDVDEEKDKEIARLQAKITELEEENKRQQNIIDAKLKQYLELMKALDEGEIAKILLKEDCGMRWYQINGEEQEVWLEKAKAITDFIKSKLTGGGE